MLLDKLFGPDDDYQMLFLFHMRLQLFCQYILYVHFTYDRAQEQTIQPPKH